MKIATLATCISLFISTFCCASAEETATAVQIVKSANGTLQLDYSELKRLLEHDDIKDRFIIVISMAGAKEKHFLLNFFVQYLRAEQNKKNTALEWIEDNVLTNGFRWQDDKKPDTSGIWYWPEVFTHDFENGDKKVAIILLDAEGSDDQFDKVFALNTLMSSIHCYNVRESVEKSDLEHLQMLNAYRKEYSDKTNEKPFRKLVLIIEDWAKTDEIEHGWQDQKVNRLLVGVNDDPATDINEMSDEVESSYDNIQAYLLPKVNQSTFDGDIEDVDQSYLDHIKEFVPEILRPENLAVKKINGQQMRANEFIESLQFYINGLQESTVPETAKIYAATAEANNLLLLDECMRIYNNSMKDILRGNETDIFNKADLNRTHEHAREQSIAQFDRVNKLGDSELIQIFHNRLENATNEIFNSIKRNNNRKWKESLGNYTEYNKKLIKEVKQAAEMLFKETVGFLDTKDPDWDIQFQEAYTFVKEVALEEFDVRKKGGNETTKVFRDKLLEKLKGDIFSQVQVCEDDFDGNEYAFPEEDDTHSSEKPRKNCPPIVIKPDLNRIRDTENDSFKDTKYKKRKYHPEPPKPKKIEPKKLEPIDDDIDDDELNAPNEIDDDGDQSMVFEETHATDMEYETPEE